MKKHREDLVKLAISKSEQHIVPLPMTFSRVSFTLATLDNFDHNDKSTMSGTSRTHDIVSVLFQNIPSNLKPTKSEISLENVDMKVKLQRQEYIPFSTNKHNLHETFTVTSDQLHLSAEDRERYEKQECVRKIQKTSSNIPSWAVCKSLHSKQQLTTMQVGFIPFIPSLVTDQSTIYTAMKNFNIVLKQLEQDAVPVFCDEGIFRIALNIYLKKQDEFSNLIPMLGGFHMAKCVLHCISKFMKGSGLDN